MFLRKLFPFWPPRKDFLRMLIEHAQKAEESLAALVRFLNGPTQEGLEAVKKIEKEGDELRRKIIEDLERTFVTEIDREDIRRLCNAIDEIADYAYTTAEEVDKFGGPSFKLPPVIFEIVDILRWSSSEIHLALETIKKYPQTSEGHLNRAKEAEDKIERRFRHCVAELFDEKKVFELKERKKDLEEFVVAIECYKCWANKVREVARHLSNFADRVIAAAEVIDDIRIKLN